MLDGIAFEVAGIPTATCVGSEFFLEANARKEVMGLPDLQIVAIPFPLGPTQEAQKKAEDAFPEIVAVVTSGGKK